MPGVWFWQRQRLPLPFFHLKKKYDGLENAFSNKLFFFLPSFVCDRKYVRTADDAICVRTHSLSREKKKRGKRIVHDFWKLMAFILYIRLNFRLYSNSQMPSAFNFLNTKCSSAELFNILICRPNGKLAWLELRIESLINGSILVYWEHNDKNQIDGKRRRSRNDNQIGSYFRTYS